MGNPTPPDDPVIIDEKFYCFTCVTWTGPDPGCTGTMWIMTGSNTGSGYKHWREVEQCVKSNELCPIGAYAAQSLVNASGPYDSKQECEDNC